MVDRNDLPQTLVDAIRYFSDPDVCFAFMVELRWPNGVTCPTCGRQDVRFLEKRRMFECKGRHPRKQFSVKVGTIFEDSHISLDKWLCAIWLKANAKNGISSYELGRALGITQKSAWFMTHRINLAMQTGTFGKLSGEVEVDETYIGGKARNMHPGARRAKGRGTVGKAVVMGLLERHGEVRTEVVPNIVRGTLHEKVREHVEPGSTIYTDELRSYGGLESEYAHLVINHAECYVKGNVHTNCMENFWSLLKRGIKGTYVSVEPFHLFRYLDEEAFRFNTRKDNDAGRFLRVVAALEGKRLQFKNLIGEAPCR